MKAYLNMEETQKLEGAARYLRDKVLIRLLIRTGCRISEALALSTNDINFAQGTITIQHLKASIRLSCQRCGARLGRCHTFCPRCGNKVDQVVAREQEHRRMRTLPLDGDTSEMLRDYIKRSGPVQQGNKMLLFGINRHRAWQIIRECAQRAGLSKLINPETGREQNISPHRLRDAFAVHAVKLDDSGDGLRHLQEHLGHQSITTTMRYRKISGDEQREWYENLWQKGIKENGD